jgi:protein-tyrosine phosphatase
MDDAGEDGHCGAPLTAAASRRMSRPTPEPPPFRIDALAAPCGGLIGLSACPGRDAGRERSLARDLADIRRWGAGSVLTLLDDGERDRLGAAGLPAAAEAHGMTWRSLPIADMRPPSPAALARWRAVAPALAAELRAGRRILIHCAAGLGRTGTMAAALLVHLGVEPVEAVAQVRAARPGAIETPEQLRFVLEDAGR